MCGVSPVTPSQLRTGESSRAYVSIKTPREFQPSIVPLSLTVSLSHVSPLSPHSRFESRTLFLLLDSTVLSICTLFVFPLPFMSSFGQTDKYKKSWPQPYLPSDAVSTQHGCKPSGGSNVQSSRRPITPPTRATARNTSKAGYEGRRWSGTTHRASLSGTLRKCCMASLVLPIWLSSSV